MDDSYDSPLFEEVRFAPASGNERKGHIIGCMAQFPSQPKSPSFCFFTTMIPVALSFQGKSIAFEGGVTQQTTGIELHERTLQALGLSADATSLKILCKGQRIESNDQKLSEVVPLPNAQTSSSKAPKPLKLLVVATSETVVANLATKRSDPTIRGFDQEVAKPTVATYQPWGPLLSKQDKNYKFCRFEACTWQSFGHRPTDGTTPHAFRAMQLLEKLATDPGVVAVLNERELVVGTLGEMDPIDDRVMQNKQAQGVCLLGYNTNAGSRIDIKLRTDDLKGFRPYSQLVGTLLHELSHNWVGEHNLLFWTNYAQMRAEYLTRHRALQSTVVSGRTTAEIAELPQSVLQSTADSILQELVPEMAQHGLHPRMIEAPIRQRCQELEQELLQGKTLGGDGHGAGDGNNSGSTMSLRERALVAAEQRRRRQQQQDPENNLSNDEKEMDPSSRRL